MNNSVSRLSAAWSARQNVGFSPPAAAEPRSSAQPLPAASGPQSSPAFASRKGSATPRSSRTSARGGSSAGPSRPACPPRHCRCRPSSTLYCAPAPNAPAHQPDETSRLDVVGHEVLGTRPGLR
uniref:Putative dehydrogenase n=1 Tax=Micrococcus sp. 28 TaxID=161213 RepID=Q8VPQ3_9MICC|nr:putative dehydrogenase [Micrococcus sp. 28]